MLNLTKLKLLQYAALCGCVALGACGDKTAPEPAAAIVKAVPKLASTGPQFTVRGVGFNVQPDGQSALAVVGQDFTAGVVVLWNGEALKTVGDGKQGWITATVPARLYEAPGEAQISVREPDGSVSNTLPFKVYAESGPAPAISAMTPGSTAAGKGFNVQPDGQSAFAITGSGFLPGSTVHFGNRELKTGFASDTTLTASVPAGAYAQAGPVSVWVKNRDGKPSNQLSFRVSAP